MRALTLNAAHDARLVELPEPEVGAGQVKVQVDYAGICGSDLSLYEYFPIPAESIHPLFGEAGAHVLGHEFSGHVVTLGEDVKGIDIGALVAVRPNVWDGTCAACLRGDTNLCENYGFIGINGGGGGFSEYVVVDASAAHVLPESVGADVAAMVESTTVAWHAVRVSGASAGSAALIIGAGPIGLALVLCLKAVGVDRVVVSELSETRKLFAARLGADVVDPRQTDVAEYVRALTEGAGVDSAFDASGVGQSTYDAAFAALRSGGTAVVVAGFHSPVSVDLNSYLMTEKHLVGSFAYTDGDFASVVEAVVAGHIDPRPLITSRIALSDVVTGGIKHLLGEGRNSEVKILVAPHG
jgi:(R,R)-butanediol dehydrogenase/meso-butanediol dehydrogenase/diacetyl reductase